MGVTRRNLMRGVSALALATSTARGQFWIGSVANGVGTVLNAASFGVVADGTTDNSTALFSLNAAAAAIAGRVTINLPPGTIAYLNNRWLYGLLNVRLVGSPTTLKCLQNQNDGFFTAYPLWVGSPFITNTLAYSGTLDLVNGFLFNTAAVGSPSITLTNSGDVSNFAVGNRILLYGYELTNEGYPPGPRYFEWRQITKIVGQTLQLDNALKWSYNAQWADIPDSIGSGLNAGLPRALLLDASYYVYPYYIELNNLNFVSNPFYQGTTGTINITAGILNIFNCTSDSNCASEITQELTINGCAFGGLFEFDKMTGDILCEYSTFNGTGGAGLDGAYASWSMSINHCIVNGAINVCPHTVSILNSSIIYNSIDGSIWQQPAEFPITSYVMGGNTFNNSISGSAPHVQALETIVTFNVDGVSGNNILVNQSGWTDTAQNDIYRRCGAGTIIQKNDGTKTGTVQDLTYNPGTSQWTIIISPSGGVPVVNETWQFRPTQNFTNLGGNTILDGNAFATFGSSPTATFSNL